ncbi:MAG: helix-turn-helix domain-containing protein [Holosporales bacterium]|jgi:DNA-binding protein Fis|nr:helix-turn-helix domain-containing protein [Holosporales bacterium]
MRKYSISAAIDDVLSNFLLLQNDVNEITGLYKTVITEVEKVLISKIMKVTRNNKQQTSKILGISRNTLSCKINALNIGGLEEID